MKRRILSIISTSCYFVFLAGGAGMAIYMKYLIDGLANSEGAEGLAAIFFAVIMVLGILYAAVSLVPFTLKFTDIFANKKALSGVSLAFDLALLIINGYALFTALSDTNSSGEAALLITSSVLLLLLSIAAAVCNILSLLPRAE